MNRIRSIVALCAIALAIVACDITFGGSLHVDFDGGIPGVDIPGLGGSDAPPALDLGGTDTAMDLAHDTAPDVHPDLLGDVAHDLASDVGPDLLPPPPFFQINHVLSTGQSLSIGYNGSPALSTSQPYSNVIFNTRNFTGTNFPIRFDPLTELSVETMSSGLANLATRLAMDDGGLHDVLISIHGQSNTPYSGLAKGTVPYQNGMNQASYGHSISVGLGKSFAVRAVTVLHGESDQSNGSTTYAADVIQWQQDYETDVRAITGQTAPVPLLHTQMSSWTRYGVVSGSLVPTAQLAACDAAPTKIYCVGPKYMVPYSDGVHLTNHGYRQIGEYHAKAYKRIAVDGLPWKPVRMKTATRSGSTVIVVFNVPVPPLVIDTTLVSDPGQNGFEYVSSGGSPVTVTAVTVTAPDTITLTLGASGTGGKVRYAMTGILGALAGPMTGPRGNVRDSDATASRNGYPLWNWGMHQELQVQP